jgi:hypothetical protein
MRIVINHLTRMKAGHICVAGIDIDTGNHVRPVLERGRFRGDMLQRNGGPFDIAAVIALDATKHIGQVPEVEDHLFDLRSVRLVKNADPGKFWKYLKQKSHTRLTEIFGEALTQQARSYTVDEGKGKSSLGCLLPSAQPKLTVNDFNYIRIELTDGTFRGNFSVTDVRLYEKDLATARVAMVRQVARRIQEGVTVILSVGLTRAWARPGSSNSVRRHYLQVNNIHLEDDPAWQDSSR